MRRILYESDNPKDISYAKYREMLLSEYVKDILEILSYDIENDLMTSKKKKLMDSKLFQR